MLRQAQHEASLGRNKRLLTLILSKGEPADAHPPVLNALVEVVALVVGDDEGGEVLDFDAPDGLHAELGIFEAFDLADAVEGEARRRAADRAEVEAAMRLAGRAYCIRAVALGAIGRASCRERVCQYV